MEIKFHYDSQDDVLTIYSNISPSETVEVTEFINVDINKEKGIVGLEIFDASEFFGKQNKELTKQFLSNLEKVNLKYSEWRNMWFINLEFAGKNKKIIIQKLPPLRRSEFVSPLIASVC